MKSLTSSAVDSSRGENLQLTPVAKTTKMRPKMVLVHIVIATEYYAP